MAEGSFKRKLAAILSADVKGYSRLMGEDEEWTVRTLNAYREAMGWLVQRYRGRVVDAVGDNLLAEFGSVVDAVNCAVEIQRELAERNAESPAGNKMEFRIGVNLGDVIEEGERIYGDGVNIAARVEGLAEPGGICISGTAYDQVKNKLGLEYEFLGEQEVKNIAEPVRVYRVLSVPGAAAHRVVRAKRRVEKKWRRTAVVVGALVIAAGVWYFQLRPVGPTVEAARVEKMAHPLPDKPSIAVLPFDNMSRDPEQEYFSDGLAEVIIAALSQIPEIFVIARNSTFAYKGKPVKIQQVSEELGVQYVLEGSVQKSEDRIRITAQLIDALSGKHLWARTYDRQLKDLFTVQDDITTQILLSLQIEITKEKDLYTCARGTSNVQAYLKFIQAMWHVYQGNIQADAMTRRFCEEAYALDPQYSSAYALIAVTHTNELARGATKSPKETLAKAFQFVEKSLSLNPSCSFPYSVLALCYLWNRQHDEAIAASEQAISLDPNFSVAHAFLANILVFAGRAKEAMGPIQTALRLNPVPQWYFFYYLGNVYYHTVMYEEAIVAYKKGLENSPDAIMNHIRLGATYSALGREKEARTEIEEVLKLAPRLSINYISKAWPYKDPADLEQVLNDLRKAGLPE